MSRKGHEDFTFAERINEHYPSIISPLNIYKQKDSRVVCIQMHMMETVMLRPDQGYQTKIITKAKKLTRKHRWKMQESN